MGESTEGSRRWDWGKGYCCRGSESLEQKKHLDKAIEDFIADPRSETEEAVVEAI